MGLGKGRWMEAERGVGVWARCIGGGGEAGRALGWVRCKAQSGAEGEAEWGGMEQGAVGYMYGGLRLSWSIAWVHGSQLKA